MTKKTPEVPAVQANDFFILTDGQLLGRLLDAEDLKPYRYPAEALIQLLWCNTDIWRTPFGERLPQPDLLSAALDVARDVAFAQVDLAKPLSDRQALARYLFLNHSRGHCDSLVALYLNEDGAWIDDQRVFTGDAERSLIRPGDILRPGLAADARHLVIAHLRTHGDFLPTKVELERTRQVRAAARVLGMTLVDSWIVTSPMTDYPQHVGRSSAPPSDVLAPTESHAGEAWMNDEVLWRCAIPLAMVLSQGHLTEEAVKSARRLLQAVRGPAGLVEANSDQLVALGLKPEQVDALRLALELGRRLGDTELDLDAVLWSPKSIARYLVEHLTQAGQDAAGAIFLDDRRAVLGHHLSGEEEVDLQGSAPRGILVEALAVGAAHVVPFLFSMESQRLPKFIGSDFYEELYETGLYFDLEIADFLYVSVSGRFLSRSRPGEEQQVKPKAKKKGA